MSTFRVIMQIWFMQINGLRNNAETEKEQKFHTKLKSCDAAFPAA